MNNEVVASKRHRSEPDRAISVVLVGCTGLLGDILERAVTASPEIEVLKSIGSAADLDLDKIDAVDVVLWNDADEETLTDWLQRRAAEGSPRVLGTTLDGRRASLWELAPRRTELGALSPDDVVSTITGAFGTTPDNVSGTSP